MPRPIHFVLDRSRVYQGVQQQLLDLIAAQLPGPAPDRGTYRQGCLNFCLFIQPRADVVMSHGVADKNYLWTQDPQARRYGDGRCDLLVPGQWLQRRVVASKYLHHGPEQVHVVGWPRLDQLVGQVPQSGSQPGRRSRPRVLWAPTHNKRKRGENPRSTSSYPAFGKYLPALARFAEVEASVHPRNRSDHTPTGALLPRADVVIADFGTTVYEAWALGKPVIFPRWLLADRVAEHIPWAAESYIFSDRIGYHPESFDEMVDILRAGPVVTADVQAFIDDYLERRYLGTSSARVAQVLLQIAAREDG